MFTCKFFILGDREELWSQSAWGSSCTTYWCRILRNLKNSGWEGKDLASTPGVLSGDDEGKVLAQSKPPKMADMGTNTLQSLSLAINTSLKIRIIKEIALFVTNTISDKQRNKPLPPLPFLISVNNTPGCRPRTQAYCCLSSL